MAVLWKRFILIGQMAAGFNTGDQEGILGFGKEEMVEPADAELGERGFEITLDIAGGVEIEERLAFPEVIFTADSVAMSPQRGAAFENLVFRAGGGDEKPASGFQDAAVFQN